MNEKFTSMEGGVPKEHGYDYMNSAVGEFDSEFYVNTNFALRPDELELVKNMDGIDKIEILGRYRFGLTIAQMFDKKKTVERFKDLMEKIMETHDFPKQEVKLSESPAPRDIEGEFERLRRSIQPASNTIINMPNSAQDTPIQNSRAYNAALRRS